MAYEERNRENHSGMVQEGTEEADKESLVLVQGSHMGANNENPVIIQGMMNDLDIVVEDEVIPHLVREVEKKLWHYILADAKED